MTNILVADPEPYVRRMLKYALERSGYAVRGVGSGSAVLEAIGESKPDVLIVDTDLPDLPARLLCREIDETWMARDFLVCVISSRLSPGEHQWVRELADAEFIAKPISVIRLVNAIRRFVERASLRRAG